MDNLELQMLLDDLYNSSFLDSIEIIYEKESEYKKSSFYKQTKIPLIQLYEKYFQYRMLNYSMQEKFNDFIREIDIKQMIETGLNWLEQLENTERVNQLITKVLENFDLDYIKNNNEELKELLQNFKEFE